MTNYKTLLAGLLALIAARASITVLLTTFAPGLSNIAGTLSLLVVYLVLLICIAHIFYASNTSTSCGSPKLGLHWNLTIGVFLGTMLFALTVGAHKLELHTIFGTLLPTPPNDLSTPSERLSPDIISLETMLSCVTAILIAPIAEEVYFRKLLPWSLLQVLKPAPAVIASAILFGIMHFAHYQIVVSIMFALILSQVYSQTKSIATCIFAHSANNCLALYVDYESPNIDDINFFNSNISPIADDLIVIGLSSVCLISLLICMKYYEHRYHHSD